ncbi:hypothetical protein SCACP_21560 [Sporomusa carbonis]|uniref:VRR-NUC domain-containing protein n=1 Tax=Sporomusa carbonis TaxID=3076075 RepID=UPI003A78653D
MNEHSIQNQIRLAISKHRLGVSFRTNVGAAWQGDVEKNPDGTITIRNPRPFKSGLPEGFSDLLVISPVTITSEMIGQTFARAGFLEVKTPKGRPTEAQLNFIKQMTNLGALAGVARSPEEAIRILKGE